MKLIDATKAMESIDEIVCTMSVCINSDYCNGMRTMKDMALHAIEEQPTVDAVPVVHGEWTIDGMNEYELSYGCIGYEPRYRCSRCGITTESYLRTEKPIMPEDADFPNYCPNCGAKMRKGDK